MNQEEQIEIYIHEHPDLKDKPNHNLIWRKSPVVVKNGGIITPEKHNLEGLTFLEWLDKNPTKLHWEKPFWDRNKELIKYRRPYYNSTWKIFKTDLNPGEEYCINDGEKNEEYFRSKEQLEILLVELNSIFKNITPHNDNLKTFGSSNRNIILLACMEVELHLRALLLNNGYKLPKGKRYTTTADYVKLTKFIELKAQIHIVGHKNLSPLNPFKDWSNEKPTESIKWYDAYNKLKHDRGSYMNLATLENTLLSMSALVLLLKIRFNSAKLFDTKSSNIFDNIPNFKFGISIDNWWYDKNLTQLINSTDKTAPVKKIKYFEKFPQ